MKHNVDIEREHPDLDSALRYLKQAGFVNLWGGKVFDGRGSLYASIGNEKSPIEVGFKTQDGDMERLRNLMDGGLHGYKSGSTDGQTDEGC